MVLGRSSSRRWGSPAKRLAYGPVELVGLVAIFTLALLSPRFVAAQAPAGAADPQATALTALMLEPLGDAEAEVARRASVEVQQTLEHQGVVFRAAPAGLSLHCETPECRAAAATRAGVDMVVSVLVWQPTSFRAEGRVEVALTDAQGDTGGAEADFVGDETLAAVRAARAALTRFAARGRVALSIEGELEGAAVLLNGRPVGTVPYRGMLSPGHHVLRVVVNGRVVFARDLNVEPGAEAIALRLDEAQRDAAGADADSDSDSDSDSGGGAGANVAAVSARAALGVLGAAALIVTSVEVARAGCQRVNAEGDCAQERVLRRGRAAAMGTLGALALGASIAWTVRARRRRAAPPVEVGVTLSPSYGSIDVTF